MPIKQNILYNDTSNINRFIAFKNPFRYRSYYYDFETKLYYLNSRYYDPELGRFINADDISILNEAKKFPNGLNLYSYCNNNPINNTDYSGFWWLFDDLIAALVGLIVGIIGQFLADLTRSLLTGKWQFSSWETYVGAAIGGMVGSWTTLYIGPVAGTAVGTAIGTFIGQGLESLTGTNVRSFGEILGNSIFTAGIAAITAGLTQYIKIPGITSGSHSFSQVWKSGISKALNHGFNISIKTISKGFISELIKSFTTGWLLNSILTGGLETLKTYINELKSLNRSI